MMAYAMAHAADDTPRALALSCARQLETPHPHSVGFVYVTASIAGDMAEIVSVLSAETGIATWVGTAGLGIAASGVAYFSRPAIVTLTADWPADAFHLLAPLATEAHIGKTASDNSVATVGVVHGDPRNPEIPAIVAGLAQQAGLFLVGGLTASRDHFPQVAGQSSEGGLSGLSIGPGIAVTVGLTQGCIPIGPTHAVTRGHGNILVSLDDLPALAVLSEEVGVADGVDLLPWLSDVHVALPVSGSDTGDFMVRNLMGIDPKGNLVAIGERVSVGDRITFVRRDAVSATKDLRRMLADVAARAPAPPQAGLYFSCCGRGPSLFPDEADELVVIREALGDIPIVGFFGNGEISGDRIYGYSGVLVLFS